MKSSRDLEIKGLDTLIDRRATKRSYKRLGLSSETRKTKKINIILSDSDIPPDIPIAIALLEGLPAGTAHGGEVPRR